MTRLPLLSRKSYPEMRTLTTRWGDNDAYGHVNNVVYYGWFDTVVNGWLIEAGLLDVATGDPIGLVVETGCRYARPLSYPEPVELGFGIDHIGRSSVRYRLGVFATGDASAAAEGHFVHVYVGRKSRQPVELPLAWREKLEMISMKGARDG